MVRRNIGKKLFLFLRERERERDRQTDRQTERQTERNRERDRHTYSLVAEMQILS